MKGRFQRRREVGAPPWCLTYADLMSLLLVLFLFLYSLRVEQPQRRETRCLRLADGAGWSYLGSIPCRRLAPDDEWFPAIEESELEVTVRSRLVGSRCRVALLGQAASREDAFRAAKAARDALEARDLVGERFVLLAQRVPSDGGEVAGPTVRVYATAGAMAED